MNDLGDVGGGALADALRLNTTLTSLDLGDNALEEDGGRALAHDDDVFYLFLQKQNRSRAPYVP